MEKTIYIFIGTTAELIKLVPVIQELKKRKKQFSIIASGQNDIKFEEFYSLTGNLTVIRAVKPKAIESSVFKFVIWSMRTFLSLLTGMRNLFRGLNTSNSYFIVHGDTVSSLIGSVVARIYGLNLVHIESGLRSFSFSEPFPEEICRYIISRLAHIHMCPNNWSMNNLQHVGGKKVNTYQNTLIEIFYDAMKHKSTHPFVLKLKKLKRPYVVLVIHRQEHVIFEKEKTKELLSSILANIPDNMDCVFLIHDLSAKFIESISGIIPQKVIKRIIKTGRLPYKDFMHVIHGAECMITDGGSNQEETYYMGKPCLIVRNRTERIEGLGSNAVLSYENKHIIRNFFQNYAFYTQKIVPLSIPPSTIICDYLCGTKKY